MRTKENRRRYDRSGLRYESDLTDEECLRSPSLVILSALNAMEAQILPRHLYEGTDILTNPHNLRPIGTGPFRFKEWQHGGLTQRAGSIERADRGRLGAWHARCSRTQYFVVIGGGRSFM
jgi:hypothetical protein